MVPLYSVEETAHQEPHSDLSSDPPPPVYLHGLIPGSSDICSITLLTARWTCHQSGKGRKKTMEERRALGGERETGSKNKIYFNSDS